MMRKMIARMMAWILMMNLVLCVPLRVAAEEFDADPVTIGEATTEEGTTQDVVVVTETVSEGTVATGSEVAVKDQTVSVEIPVEEATTKTPVENTLEANTDDNTIEYDTPAAEGSTNETVHVEESYDLKVEVTDAEKASGQLTDIEYDVSLDQKTTTTDGTEPTVATIPDVDKTWNEEASETGSTPPAIKVNLSVNGMEDDPTRVEHKYTDENGEEKTEYYYNAKQVEEGSNKKTFTVTVKEVAEAVTEKVVSLWTNFLGIFHITNDAFENQNTKEMSTTLAEAVNGANNGDTVTMLRDYSTNIQAELTNSDGKGSDVTIDLNKNTYTYIWDYEDDYEAIAVNGINQNLTIQNGTIESSDDVLVVNGSRDQVIIDNSNITGKAASSWTVQTSSTSSNSAITIKNGSTVTGQRGVQLSGKLNTLNVENSTVNAKNGNSIGLGVVTFGKQHTVNIKSGSKVNSERYGLYLTGTPQTLNVENSYINTLDGSGVGIVAVNDTQTVNVKGSIFNTGLVGLYAEGNNYNLKVDNSTINATGTNGSGIYTNNKNASNGVLEISDSVINSGFRGLDIWTNGGTITMSNTTVNSKQDGIIDAGNKNAYRIEDSTINYEGSYGITHNGSFGGAKIELIGTYLNPNGTGKWGIYVSGSKSSTTSNGMNNLILTDSTIKGSETGVEVKYTNVTINNSELVGFGAPPEYVGNNNGTTTSGVALAVTDNRIFEDDGTLVSPDNTGGTITINSGYFYGHKDIDNIFVATKLNADDPQATIQLNGGRFVNATYLYKYTDANHAVVSSNDGSDYPYAVVGADAVPSRPGYTFLGYKDDKGNDITLKDAITQEVIAYAQWEKVVEVVEAPVQTPTTEAPVQTPTIEAPKDTSVIIVEPDSKGNNVDVTIQGTTAQVSVSTPAGDAAAVSEVTVTSVEQLRRQGVETICVQVEENVTLELGVAKDADNGLGDTIVITRNEDTLVISSGEETNITIHMEALKAASTEAVHIRYDEGVITVSFGSTVVFRMEVLEALRANKDLTVKLEGRVLKLYDKNNNLIQQIPM